MRRIHAIVSALVIAGAVAAMSLAADETVAPKNVVETTAVRQYWTYYNEATVDFKKEMDRLKLTGTFDPASVIVYAVNDDGTMADAVPARFIPAADFDASAKPVGRVVWEVTGDGIFLTQVAVDDQGYIVKKPEMDRKHKLATKYWITFDVKGKSTAAAPAAANVPDHGDIFPNGGFEEANAAGVPDKLIYFRPESMSLDTTVFHAGKNSLRLNPSADNSPVNFSVMDLRVEAGRTYTVSFWGKALGTEPSISCVSEVMWLDKNREQLKDDKGVALTASLIKENYTKTDFDWRFFETSAQAPAGACFGIFYVQTYAKAGHVWIDDMSVRSQPVAK